MAGKVGQVGKQIVAIAVIAAWSFVWSYVIMKVIEHTVGIDVDADTEEKGLDAVQMGDRVLVLSEGRAVATLDTANGPVTVQGILEAAFKVLET